MRKSEQELNISKGIRTRLAPSFNAAWKNTRDSFAFYISHKYPKIPKCFSGTIFIFFISLKLKQKAYIYVHARILELCALCTVT